MTRSRKPNVTTRQELRERIAKYPHQVRRYRCSRGGTVCGFESSDGYVASCSGSLSCDLRGTDWERWRCEKVAAYLRRCGWYVERRDA